MASVRAQTESIGILLLVAVIVITVGLFGIYAIGQMNAEQGPTVAAQANISAAELSITHVSGDALNGTDLYIQIHYDGTQTTYDFAADGTYDTDGDGLFESGEQWTLDGNPPYGQNDRVRLFLVHKPSGTILLETQRTVLSPTPTATVAPGPPQTPPGIGGPAPGQKPTADFSYSPTNPESGEVVHFTDESTDNGQITDWQWDFGDGSTSSKQNPDHAYSSDGTYTVTLTVTDDSGNTDSVSKTLTVYTPTTTLTAIEPEPAKMGDPAGEFIRLHFASPKDTTGWELRLERSGSIQQASLPDETVNGTIYLARNPSSFSQTWSVNNSSVYVLNAKLEDQGANITLYDDSDREIDQMAYGTEQTTTGWSISIGGGEVGYRVEQNGEYVDTDSASDWSVTGEDAFFNTKTQNIPAPGVAFVDDSSGYLKTVDEQHRLGFYPVTNPQDLGPMTADLDGDGRVELPYVGSKGNLRIIDLTSQDSTFVKGNEVKSGTTRMAVGDLTTDLDTTPGVFFRGRKDVLTKKERGENLQTFSLGGGPNPSSVKAYAVSGIADFDGSGDMDIVYVEKGHNAEIAYYDHDSATKDEVRTGVRPQAVNAIGSPADYDDDGVIEVPYVNSNNNVALADASGADGVLTSTGNVSATSMGKANLTGDSTPEIVFVSDSKLFYVTESGTVVQLTDEYGYVLDAAVEQGAS